MGSRSLLNDYLDRGKAFKWKKIGLVFKPCGSFSHGSHPCAIRFKEDLFIIAFTRRDRNQKSHVFLSYAELSNAKLTLINEPKLALSPGELGYFDCDGVISVCLIADNGALYLYYVGWQNLPKNMWSCDTGRAILDPDRLTIKREFSGPIFGRDKNNPLFAAATAFQISGKLWQAWYNSGIEWKKSPSGLQHVYGIKYADSSDGVNWTSYPEISIPFADDYEYAFGRPSVIKSQGVYFMWFAHRASEEIKSYRMGFAWSRDGRLWQRNDDFAGIDVSQDGWDSEMVCYPYVFEHCDDYFMLYNGNAYGKTGFGLATLEQKI